MKKTWRLLDTGALSAAENMTLEKVILEARSREIIPDTLHFLQFSPHCALVGYHQAVELEVEKEYCRAHGIEINRRISGGGNLYMDEGQLGWEIFTIKDAPGIPARLEDFYRLMCKSAMAGLKKLGVKASYRPANDIEVNGRKISGTGGTGKGNALLYHGTILTDFDVDTMIACLKLPLKKLENHQIKSFQERVTCLKEVLGYLPPIHKIKDAMAEGFAEVFGINLEPAGLSEWEKQLFKQELPYFQSEAWIYGRRNQYQASDLVESDYKSSGGLIRVALRLDKTRQRIKAAFITGDFFAYPERSILDLEAVLKNHSSREADIYSTVTKFFIDHNIRIPGCSSNDFSYALVLAIEKAGQSAVDF